MYTITDIAPTDAEFIALIAAALDAWQETLYPAESNHLLDPWPAAAADGHRPGNQQPAGAGGRWLRGYCPQ